MYRKAIVLAVSLLMVAGASALFGQPATGLPPFGSFTSGTFDTINNSNLNAHFEIPIINRAGRGTPANYTLTYDNSVWYPAGSWVPVRERDKRWELPAMMLTLAMYGPVTAPPPGPVISALLILIGSGGLFRLWRYLRQGGRVAWPNLVLAVVTLGLLIGEGIRCLLR